MHRRHRTKNMIRSQRQLSHHLQFVRNDIQQHFGIRFRVDVAQVLTEQFFLELDCVGEITVVRQCQAEW